MKVKKSLWHLVITYWCDIKYFDGVGARLVGPSQPTMASWRTVLQEPQLVIDLWSGNHGWLDNKLFLAIFIRPVLRTEFTEQKNETLLIIKINRLKIINYSVIFFSLFTFRRRSLIFRSTFGHNVGTLLREEPERLWTVCVSQQVWFETGSTPSPSPRLTSLRRNLEANPWPYTKKPSTPCSDP